MFILYGTETVHCHDHTPVHALQYSATFIAESVYLVRN